MGAAEDQIGVLGTDAAACLLRHAGLGPQQEEPLAVPGHPRQQPLGKVDARYLALQRAAQDFRGVDHPHAVGQHQIGPQQGLPEGRIVLGGQQKLRAAPAAAASSSVRSSKPTPKTSVLKIHCLRLEFCP